MRRRDWQQRCATDPPTDSPSLGVTVCSRRHFQLRMSDLRATEQLQSQWRSHTTDWRLLRSRVSPLHSWTRRKLIQPSASTGRKGILPHFCLVFDVQSGLLEAPQLRRHVASTSRLFFFFFLFPNSSALNEDTPVFSAATLSSNSSVLIMNLVDDDMLGF